MSVVVAVYCARQRRKIYKIRIGMMIERAASMKFRRIRFGLALGLCLCAAGAAQVPVQPVQWEGLAIPKTPVKQGSRFAVELSAEIQNGWHVYGLTQVPGGPTPLRIALDENEAAQIAGAPSGTVPIKKQDPSFQLETQFYTQSLTLHIPLQVKQHSAIGKQSIPVSVRFQACSDRTCLPPRTVHLSIPIEVLAGT